MTLENVSADSQKLTLRRAAAAAGIAYLFALVQGFALGFPANSILVIPGDIAATARSIADHELLYRITIVNQLLMYASVVVLAVALYVILRTVNRGLALLALSFRLTEAILSVVAVFPNFFILELLRGDSSAFGSDQVHALVQGLMNLHGASSGAGLLFTGLGSIVFYALFVRSRYLPRLLSLFGLLAYVLLIAAVLIDMLRPGASTKTLLINILQFAPVILFEAVTGFWLLLAGVRFRAQGGAASSVT
jgi:hypothetical protein